MKKLKLLLFLTVLSGCNGTDSPPSGALSENEMVNILADIHIMEARVSKMGLLSLDSSTIVSEKLKLDLLKKYKTDSSTYNKSYKFYSTQPNLFEGIYAEVTKKIESKIKKKDYKGI